MFFLFLILLTCIPLCIGITILVLFKKNNLSKIIFIFLLLASFWQLDVAFLYSFDLFKEETIEILFQALSIWLYHDNANDFLCRVYNCSRDIVK